MDGKVEGQWIGCVYYFVKNLGVWVSLSVFYLLLLCM